LSHSLGDKFSKAERQLYGDGRVGGGAEEEEEERKKKFGRLVTFWFGTFTMLFHATGCVVHHENTR